MQIVLDCYGSQLPWGSLISSSLSYFWSPVSQQSLPVQIRLRCLLINDQTIGSSIYRATITGPLFRFEGQSLIIMWKGPSAFNYLNPPLKKRKTLETMLSDQRPTCLPYVAILFSLKHLHYSYYFTSIHLILQGVIQQFLSQLKKVIFVSEKLDNKKPISCASNRCHWPQSSYLLASMFCGTSCSLLSRLWIEHALHQKCSTQTNSYSTVCHKSESNW